MSKRVVVGLSGGVDSSVAALLLKNQGFEVIGIFMKNWHDSEVTISNECPWIEDSNDALMIADQLGIPFQTIDLSEEYKNRIVDYMFYEYSIGRTPNPDVLCNREIKFDVFMKTALNLGADYIATGHYCQKDTYINNGNEIYRLLAGSDSNKDQSYFLCSLNQYQLSKAIFPIGHLKKSEVRKIAEENNLITAKKKDSQGLCFVGKIKLPDFLKQKLKKKIGHVVEISENFNYYKTDEYNNSEQNYDYKLTDGEIIGEHIGAHYYTIGQRKGLNIGGKSSPLFVINTNINENIVFVGMGENHRGLFRSKLICNLDKSNFIREDLKPQFYKSQYCNVRIRYRQELQKAKLIIIDNNIHIEFDYPQKAISSGQFACWYIDNELIGSGEIN